MRALAALSVAMVLASLGCADPLDARRDSLIRDEVATITSLALLDGKRTPEERKAISGYGVLVQQHLTERGLGPLDPALLPK